MLPKNYEMTADQKKQLMTVATKLAREVGYPNAKRLYKFAKNWFEYDGRKLWNDEYYFTEWAERMRDGKDYINAETFSMLQLLHLVYRKPYHLNILGLHQYTRYIHPTHHE